MGTHKNDDVVSVRQANPEATLQSVTLMQFGTFLWHQPGKIKDKLADHLLP